jgi:hypothetical protein
MPSNLYPHDIDGLPALAVLEIILSHSELATLLGRKAGPPILRYLNDS